MKIFLYISEFIVPCLLLGIVVYGISMEVEVYHTFIEGAESGFKTVIQIMPTLIGLMVGVGILRASGFLEWLGTFLGRFSTRIGFTTGLLLDVYKEFGTDSYLGRIASISMSCTETIFYTMSVYFMTVKVKKTRYTLAGALLATLGGLAASVILAGMMG